MIRNFALLLLTFLGAAPGHAALINVVATGVIDVVSDPLGLLPFPAPEAGSPISIAFTLDLSASDFAPDDPALGLYPLGVTNLVLTLGEAVVPGQGMPSTFVRSDAGTGPFGDLWITSSGGTCFDAPPAPCRFAPIGIFFSAIGDTVPVAPLDSDALIVPPWPYAWTDTEISYAIIEAPGDGTNVWLAEISGPVGSLVATAVPVPGAAWLLPAGLAAALLRARRRPPPRTAGHSLHRT